MKKTLIFGIIIVIFFGCSNQKSQDDSVEEQFSELSSELSIVDEEIEIDTPELIYDEIIAVLEAEDDYPQFTGLGLELIIICEFNLDTGIRTILTGQYIYTQ